MTCSAECLLACLQAQPTPWSKPRKSFILVLRGDAQHDGEFRVESVTAPGEC